MIRIKPTSCPKPLETRRWPRMHLVTYYTQERWPGGKKCKEIANKKNHKPFNGRDGQIASEDDMVKAWKEANSEVAYSKTSER